jgi:hypothetical protein
MAINNSTQQRKIAQRTLRHGIDRNGACSIAQSDSKISYRPLSKIMKTMIADGARRSEIQ